MAVEGNFTFSFNQSAEVERTNEARNARAGGAQGGGWLMAIALTLGKIADAMGERMLKLAEKIDALQEKQEKDPSAKDPETGDGLTELNAKLQVLGQQLGQMLQMLATIVKTIGEGNKDIARKQ
jgi:DNA anti-recombination protein RmuC